MVVYVVSTEEYAVKAFIDRKKAIEYTDSQPERLFIEAVTLVDAKACE